MMKDVAILYEPTMDVGQQQMVQSLYDYVKKNAIAFATKEMSKMFRILLKDMREFINNSSDAEIEEMKEQMQQQQQLQQVAQQFLQSQNPNAEPQQ